MFNLSASKDRFDKLLEVVAKRHEKFADVLTKVFKHQEKLNQIVRQRNFVTDSESRFFLALLLNVEGKERIFELIKSKYPKEEPIDEVLDWIYKLANTKVFGYECSKRFGSCWI